MTETNSTNVKNIILLLVLFPCLLNGQVQIGNDIDGEAPGDHSGRSISLSDDGNVIAIGASENEGNGENSGHVRIYENQSGVWVQIGSDIDADEHDALGFSVKLSADGEIVAVGAIQNFEYGFDPGFVRVYENQSGNWIKIGDDIVGEGASNFCGAAIALSNDGSVIAIGAPWNSGNGTASGHVRIFENQSGSWTQIGGDIDGELEGDQSGAPGLSISGDGTVVAIGSASSDENGVRSGHVRIFENQSEVWTQIGDNIVGEAADDRSGSSVSLSEDGNIVAIGAFLNDGGGASSGHVRVYENQNGAWTQIGDDIDGESWYDLSGISIDISGDGTLVAIGAPFNDGDLGTNASVGHVRLYQNQSGTWTQVGRDIDGEAWGDQSGQTVSLSSDGNVVAIGSLYNDGNGGSSGSVRVYDVSPEVLGAVDKALIDFYLYPNPASNIVNVQIRNTVILEAVNIYNNLGQLLLSNNESSFDISQLSTGLYIVEIETNKGTGSKKLVKQ